MSEFDPYEPIVPTMVRELTLELRSVMVEQFDINGQPTGTYAEQQGITITAIVTDDPGNLIETNQARDSRVVAIGLISQAQKDQLQALLDELRVTSESRLLPAP